MTRDEIKREVFGAIERRAEEIIGLGETIRRHPELGFKEVKTARLVEETLGRLGLAPKTGLAVTGVRADLAGRGGDGPTFAVLGELDALVVAGHPEADAQSGAAHACGHNAQVAGMLGAAMGLVDAKAVEHLAGRVAFFAVPAEEYGDIEWRVGQARKGALEFLGGKPELLRLGHLDDVDLAMMIHLTSRPEDGQGRGAHLQQRLHREDRALRGQGGPRGRSAPPRRQRPLRRHRRARRHQRHSRDVPRRGHHSRAPDHHPRRLAGERHPRRGPPRDLRARAQRGGHPRRRAQGGPRLQGRGARAGRHRGDRDPARLPCPCGAIPS